MEQGNMPEMGNVHYIQVAAKVFGAWQQDLFQRYPDGIPVLPDDWESTPRHEWNGTALQQEVQRLMELLFNDYPPDLFEHECYYYSCSEKDSLRFSCSAGRKKTRTPSLVFCFRCGSSHSAAAFSWDVCHGIRVVCEATSDDSHNTIEFSTPEGWGDHETVVPVELFMAAMSTFVQKFELEFWRLRTTLFTTV